MKLIIESYSELGGFAASGACFQLTKTPDLRVQIPLDKIKALPLDTKQDISIIFSSNALVDIVFDENYKSTFLIALSNLLKKLNGLPQQFLVNQLIFPKIFLYQNIGQHFLYGAPPENYFQYFCSGVRQCLQDLHTFNKNQATKIIWLTPEKESNTYYFSLGNQNFLERLCRLRREISDTTIKVPILVRTDDATEIMLLRKETDKLQCRSHAEIIVETSHLVRPVHSHTALKQSKLIQNINSYLLHHKLSGHLSLNITGVCNGLLLLWFKCRFENSIRFWQNMEKINRLPSHIAHPRDKGIEKFAQKIKYFQNKMNQQTEQYTLNHITSHFKVLNKLEEEMIFTEHSFQIYIQKALDTFKSSPKIGVQLKAHRHTSGFIYCRILKLFIYYDPNTGYEQTFNNLTDFCKYLFNNHLETQLRSKFTFIRLAIVQTKNARPMPETTIFNRSDFDKYLDVNTSPVQRKLLYLMYSSQYLQFLPIVKKTMCINIILQDPISPQNSRYPDGATLLIDAVLNENIEMITGLLKLGADVAACDKSGNSAEYYATKGKHFDLLQIFKQQRALKTLNRHPLIDKTQHCS